MVERPSTTLTARERRALHDIEQGLRSDDPALADELEFHWWRRRLLASPSSWAWIGAGALAMVVGFLAGGLVVAAFVSFVLAVFALDRCGAAAVADLSFVKWTTIRTFLGLDIDAGTIDDE